MIKILKSINVLKQYLYRATKNNTILDSKEIKDSKEMIRRRNDYIPLSGNYNLVEFDNFDIQKFVAEVDMLTIDKNTISDYISYLFESIKNRLLLNEIQKRIAKNKINKISKDLTYLVSNQFIDGFTTIFDFKKDFRNNDESIEINSNTIKLKTHNETILEKKKYAEDSVSISVKKYIGTPNINGKEPEIQGTKLSLIDDSFESGIYVTVFSLLNENIGINIRANIDVKNINSITLYMEEPNIAQKIKVSIDITGMDLRSVFDQVVKTDKIIVNFPTSNVKYIYIEIEQSLPNYTIDGLMAYKFNLKKIKTAETSFVKNGNLISNSIPIKTDTRYITIVSEEIIPENTLAKYKISYDKNEDGNWINFKEVKPITRENKIENYIKIGVKNYLETIKPDETKWNYLVPDKTYGGKLYLIKDLTSIVTGKKVLEESIKLYRGIDDWSITKERKTNIQVFTNIPLYFNYSSELKGYAHLPICAEYEEDVEATGLYTLKLKYKIKKDMEYNFRDEKFNRIILNVLNWDTTPTDSGATLLFSEKLVPGKKYKVKYFFSLDSIKDKNIKVIESRIYNSAVELKKEIDYNIVDYTDVVNGKITKAIEIIKNSRYTGEPVYLDMKISIEDTKYTKSYTTFFFSESNTNLEIGSFTKEEIDLGNFHKINGEEVSKESNYNLSYGYYKIETTAPFIDMINSITGNTSKAFIKIPKNILKKGYEASLRKIPIYELVLNNSGNDRQFSFHNNCIYLNRIPDYIISLNDINAEGKYLKCVKINEDSQIENLPETFRLEFNYVEANQIKEISLQISLENLDKEVSRTPEIKKLGINEFNTEI